MSSKHLGVDEIDVQVVEGRLHVVESQCPSRRKKLLRRGNIYIFRAGQMLCTAIISTMMWAAGWIDWTLLPNDSFSQPARDHCRNGLWLSKRPTTARLSAKAAGIYNQGSCDAWLRWFWPLVQPHYTGKRETVTTTAANRLLQAAIFCLYSVNQYWSSLYSLHQLSVAPWLRVSSIHTSLDFLCVVW